MGLAQNEVKAKPALPERVRSMEGLGVTFWAATIAFTLAFDFAAAFFTLVVDFFADFAIILSPPGQGFEKDAQKYMAAPKTKNISGFITPHP